MKCKEALPAAIAGLALLLCCFQAASADNIVGAAHNLVQSTEETDPNALRLMCFSIGLLFFFALSLIFATSFHLFRRKPGAKVKTAHREPAESTTPR